MADQRGRNRLPAQSRRAQIMQVATDLFAAGAYEDTSMEAIAEKVGIRKASLYYYFTSKDDLLTQMHNERVESIVTAHNTLVSAGELDPRTLLLTMMTDLVTLVGNHPRHLRLFFERVRDLPGDRRDRISEQSNQYRRMLAAVLDRGVAEGTFAIADTNLTALAILGMCDSVYYWFRPDGPRTAEQIAKYFYDTVIHGLAKT
ncbi:TetR/AcrR family transcriptional regulator [Nocardia sp. alder85J]|uniref:TetR/AcrR family transcriptional regulator n=1 Tax=Nocardia sp. alder85J TaxID=2862949 RepID=UPI001CD7D407|nr:TetR/AcrR family transcriptional regulator [Nocardia sp. alder85J]MCX4092099.1 TetR/AcrR family transcriptional regulator [Nocardia sp. alder85J]